MVAIKLALALVLGPLTLVGAAPVGAGPIGAAPAANKPPVRVSVTLDTLAGFLCSMPVIKRYCPKQAAGSSTFSTVLGSALAAIDGDAYRFSVRYANAARWTAPTVVNQWALPNGFTDPTKLPLVCPQTDVDSSQYSEDCLSMVLHIPKTAKPNSGLPVMVWIHGGSFLNGGANAPGLDGSKLASATNSIVAVIQYRLGGLGFLPPNGGSNLAVKDAIAALQFINKVVPSLGGSSKVTVAGQSSGAHMIRALLAAPSAQSLFSYASLHSDPMDYGFNSPSSQSALVDDFVSNLGCSASDSACLSKLSLGAIVDACSSTALNAQLGQLGLAVMGGEGMRPVLDGSLITASLASTSQFRSASKPLMISTVPDEAALTIYGYFDQPVSASDYPGGIETTYFDGRQNVILSSPYYAVSNNSNASDGGKDDIDYRPQLETLYTDGLWRCPSWTLARNYAGAGGQAFVGQYTVGAHYPGSNVDECLQPGVVCHQDDIQIVFGTAPSPTAVQQAAIKEAQARYGAFMRTGNPNAPGLPQWTAASSTDTRALRLGGVSVGAVPVGACVPTLWGDKVPYDYQLYAA